MSIPKRPPLSRHVAPIQALASTQSWKAGPAKPVACGPSIDANLRVHDDHESRGWYAQDAVRDR